MAPKAKRLYWNTRNDKGEWKLICRFTVSLEPKSKSNQGRWWKGHYVGAPKDVRVYEAVVKAEAIKAMKGLPPSDKPIKYEAYYTLGTQRVKDLPNLNKSPCDNLNKVVYVDDRQIIETHERLLYIKGKPEVLFEIYEWIE